MPEVGDKKVERLVGLKKGPILLKVGRLGVDVGLDISPDTCKGWLRAFTPDHHLLQCYRLGKVALWATVRQYSTNLQSVPMSAWKRLRDEGSKNGEITLLCTCPSSAGIGSFCHTTQLIDYAVRRWPNAFRDK